MNLCNLGNAKRQQGKSGNKPDCRIKYLGHSYIKSNWTVVELRDNVCLFLPLTRSAACYRLPSQHIAFSVFVPL